MAPRFRKILPFAAALSLAALIASASSSCSSSSAVSLASNCSINSDCNSPLVCAFAKCHNACRESRDCSAGERCVLFGTAGTCQLPAESTCSGASATCQSGEVCGGDQQCRQQCSPSAPCPHDDFCLPSGGSSACFTPSNTTDLLTLVAAGLIGLDGSVTSDGAQSSSDGSGSNPDGATSTPDATKSDAADGSSTVVPNTCTVAQTHFGNTAQGDTNASFTSGVGVRTATRLLIFNGYAGGGDAGDAGTDNEVYVQAFDPTTANSLGPAQPLFGAPPGTGFSLESASVAPTGEIALAFNYGGDHPYQRGSLTRTALYAAFLGPSTDAGPAGVALQRTAALVSGQIIGPAHITWSVATGAFVFSWEYGNAAGGFLGTKNFRPNGQAAGGTDPVPTDQPNTTVGGIGGGGADEASVAAGPNFFGVSFLAAGNGPYDPYLTILDLNGNQVGSALHIAAGVNRYWATVAATAQGFVYVYDDANARVSEVFVPTSSDAGAVLPAGDAGLAGFTFTGGVEALDAHAIGDDTGGIGGVGVALLYATGLSFAYVNANGATHVGPLSVIPHTYAPGDQIYITNFGGSFGLSLYSAATQSTQMAASGCQ